MVLGKLQDTMESFSTAPFTLQDIEGFPYERYSEQLSQYEEAERWFTGTALKQEVQAGDGEKIDLYPMRVNPLISTVLKHAFILLGEAEDDSRPLIVPKIAYQNDAEKALAETAEEALNMVWWENEGRALMMENAIMAEIYGGCVFKANYIPWEEKKREIPIAIERVNPKGFIGTPKAGSGFRLAEAWFVKEINAVQAREYGYTGGEETVWYVEKWDEETYSIYVDGVLATKRLGDGQEHPLTGENLWEFVPAVYIPHIRVGAFLGINTFDHLKGIVKELNLRFADFGDAVNDDSHAYVAMRNTQGSPTVKSIAQGIKAIDLGSPQNISGNEPEPDLFEIRKARASTAMKDLVSLIYDQYRRDSFVPPVAEGEDEGSQRSGLTLAMRFWPLTSHVGIERLFWTAGLDLFQPFLLKIMAIKKIGGITEAHTKMRMKQVWAPMMPRDREADVQEWVQRAQADLGSIEHLLTLTGDVENPEEVIKQMLEWKEALAKIEAEAMAKFGPQMAPPGAGGGGGSPNTRAATQGGKQK